MPDTVWQVDFILFIIVPFGAETARFHMNYRKISNIRRTKTQNFNAFRLVLHLSLPNLLKPGVK